MAVAFQNFAFFAGVFLHLAVYRRGEWDLAVPKLCFFYAAVQAALIGYEHFASIDSHNSKSLALAVQKVAWISFCHLMGIFLSMLTYRLALHPLRSFPGPFWARISNFYVTLLSARKLHLYEEVESLHEKYGDFVRLGTRADNVTLISRGSTNTRVIQDHPNFPL